MTIRTISSSLRHTVKKRETISSPKGPVARSLTTRSDKQSKKIAVISGAGAYSARPLIKNLMERNYQVVGLTSNKDNLKLNGPGIEFVHVSRDEVASPETIEKVTKEGMKKLGVTDCTQATLVNLVGGAVAPKGSTLEKVNRDIPLSFLEGATRAVENHADKVSIVQFSSIAATIQGDSGKCEYASIKNKTDKEILALQSGNKNVVIMRPGIILPNSTSQEIIDKDHDYNHRQFANSHFIPLLGSGDQVLPMVYDTCLNEAAINGAESDEVIAEIINAMSSDPMTQKELYARYNKKGIGFIHVPYNLAHTVAEQFPMGRLSPYAVKLLEVLDNDPVKAKLLCSRSFVKLLGREPKSIRDDESTEIVASKAPIGRHISKIFTDSVKNPNKFVTLSSAFVRSLADVSVSKIKR